MGLPFFEGLPFTIDGPRRTLVLESPPSLLQRGEAGRSFPLRLERQGPALDTFVQMSFSSEHAEVLMDTGSRSVILDLRYAEALDIDLESEDVRHQEGSDETGNAYHRYYTTLGPQLTFGEGEGPGAEGLEVMFQSIIHDGLIGTDYMNRFVLTWDLEGERLIVGG